MNAIKNVSFQLQKLANKVQIGINVRNFVSKKSLIIFVFGMFVVKLCVQSVVILNLTLLY